MDNPLHQFEVITLIPINFMGYNLSFTNSALFMFLTVLAIFSFFYFGTRNTEKVPGRFQSLVEITFEFIQHTVQSNIGQKEGLNFVPFILSLFLFILFGNMFGMLPYAFTFTSQIILTFSLASIVFILVTLVGIMTHGLKFLVHFMPSGVPIVLAPLIVPIELISYLSRPISLSIRLFANMMAGHTMLKVFAIFTVLLGIGGLATICVNILLIGFEFLVAFLQAYVFSILTCLYLKDALSIH